MEFVGDEKRIRAQFCNLALQDEVARPDFEELWDRAESANLRDARWTTSVHNGSIACFDLVALSTAEGRRTPSRLFAGHFPKLVFAVVVMIAMSATVFWSRQGDLPSVEQIQAIALGDTEASTAVSRPVEWKTEMIAVKTSPPIKKRRFVVNHRTTKTTVKQSIDQNFVALSNWQSPTEGFLQSPVTPVFKSLPPLNQAVKELESYLSTSESKESK